MILKNSLDASCRSPYATVGALAYSDSVEQYKSSCEYYMKLHGEYALLYYGYVHVVR